MPDPTPSEKPRRAIPALRTLRCLRRGPDPPNTAIVTEQILLSTSDALVRILTLAPEEDGQWHRHSEIDDCVVCLRGAIRLESSDPDESIVLQPGEQARVDVGRRHRVSNPSSQTSSYVLVQGPGRYDFLTDQSLPQP